MTEAHKYTKRTLVRAAKYEKREVLVTPAKYRMRSVKVEDAAFVRRVNVRLTMNMAEAEALRAVLMRIGGDPETTRRGLTAAVNDALNKAGVKWELGDSDDLSPRYRSLSFEDWPRYHGPDSDSDD